MTALASFTPTTPRANTAAPSGYASFDAVVERYWEMVFQACYRLVGDRCSAEDAAQETFFSAYRAMPRFQEGNMTGWLLRIARNICIDELRRRRRRPVFRPPHVSQSADVADAAAGPEAIVQSVERSAELLALVRELPPAQQHVVLLVDLHGYGYGEAAQVLDVALGTVKSRLHRAHQALRTRLEPAA
jgi:RNA polymerase sigma-70 factor (ECF subfamily)